METLQPDYFISEFGLSEVSQELRESNPRVEQTMGEWRLVVLFSDRFVMDLVAPSSMLEMGGRVILES